MFGTAAVLVFVLASLTSEQAFSASSMGTPIVGYWNEWGAPSTLNATIAQQAVDGGYNLAWAYSMADVNLAQQYGLRTMLSNPTLLSPASLDGGTKQAQLNALIDQYKVLPAAYSYFIKDEPTASEFAGLGDLVSYIRQRDPNHKAYINLFPNYAPNSSLGTNGYNEYLSQYRSIVQPSLLSYDHYQLATSSDGSGYLNNLGQVATAAKQADVPFVRIVQACKWSYLDWRVPNANEMRFLVYSTLAYGAQGIEYFTYRASDPGNYGGIVDYDGVPTPIYTTLTPLNHEFVAIAKQYQSLKWIGTYLKGYSTTRQWPWSPLKYNGPPGTATLPSGSPFTIGNISEISYSDGDPLKGVLFGFFDKDGTALSDATVALIENLDYTVSKDYTVTGPGNLSVFDATTGRWIPKGSSQVVLHLGPGGGFLVGLTSEVPEPSALFILLSGAFGLSAYAWHKRR
jgi:hypothetical protein